MMPIFTNRDANNKSEINQIISKKIADDYIKSREDFKNDLRKALGIEYPTKEYNQEIECTFIMDEYDSISKDKIKA